MSQEPAEAEFMDQFPPEERIEHPPLKYDLGPDAEVVQRWVEWRGRIVWFAMIHHVLVGEEWVEVIRADTCHDEAHVHRFDKNGAELKRQTLCSLSTIDDVDRGWDAAADLVMDQWEENLRRWNR